LNGLKVSVKNILKQNCHLETKLSIIKDEIQEYQDAKDELDHKSKNIYKIENDLKKELE
jgi:hypothetical protein